MGRKRGFLAFVLSAVFLFAIAASASYFSKSASQQGGSEYSRMQASRLSLVAIKQAAYSSFSQTAQAAGAAALSAGEDPRIAIRAALLARAISLEAELKQRGYDASFWCGSPSEDLISSAISGMQSSGAAAIPDGSSPLASPQCAGTFDVDVSARKIHISSLGFSLYSGNLGTSQVGLFPASYEVNY